MPPSNVIVAPLTYAPALEARKIHVPAASSGEPIRPKGTLEVMISPNVSRVCFITSRKKQG